MELFGVQLMAPFSMCCSFPVRQTSGGSMDASQCKAELTISRLVSKYPLSRALHYSETMILKDSVVHFAVHSTVPAFACSGIRDT